MNVEHALSENHIILAVMCHVCVWPAFLNNSLYSSEKSTNV